MNPKLEEAIDNICTQCRHLRDVGVLTVPTIEESLRKHLSTLESELAIAEVAREWRHIELNPPTEKDQRRWEYEYTLHERKQREALQTLRAAIEKAK